ncbi:uncharacterized protein BDV14DRAFT_177889 [Aspergillus stella-maris]|uniref:uncharacterized protein n=1 Tax=Aspergillus stella-maris TaxID=1810926 RepID=UPI003CCCAC29
MTCQLGTMSPGSQGPVADPCQPPRLSGHRLGHSSDPHVGSVQPLSKKKPPAD